MSFASGKGRLAWQLIFAPRSVKSYHYSTGPACKRHEHSKRRAFSATVRCSASSNTGNEIGSVACNKGSKKQGVSTVVFRQCKDSSTDHVNDLWKVLVVRRAKDPYRGFWSLPGGGIEAEESVLGAALREVEEETGLRVEKVRGPYMTLSPTSEWNVHICAGLYAGADSPRAMDDVDEAKFLFVSEVRQLEFRTPNLLDVVVKMAHIVNFPK